MLSLSAHDGVSRYPTHDREPKRHSSCRGGIQLRRLFPGLTLLILLASFLRPAPAVQAETQFQASEAQAVLDSMTPEERVGQLFLVTFQGTDTHDQTEI